MRLSLSEDGRSVGGFFSQHGFVRVEKDDGGRGFGRGWGTACAANIWTAGCCQVLGGLAELGRSFGLPELPGSGSRFAARTRLFWQRCAFFGAMGLPVYLVNCTDIG